MSFKRIGWLILVLGAGILAYDLFKPQGIFILSPLVSRVSRTEEPEKNKNNGVYAPYSFEALGEREYAGSEIKIEKEISKEENFTSYLFSYLPDGQKVTGQLNLPQKAGKLPAVIMLRGYADKEIYFTGLGTRKAAGALAENGFITLAPDFLGFGGSDPETTDVLLNRFKRPITVLNLIASVKTLPEANPDQIFLWAHSNGGQIALSVLEISQFAYPTSLWAPVTESFPECIINYIDQDNLTPDSQKVLEAINNFTKSYDPQKYSTTSYYGKIKAPLLIHQGGADYLVPAEWQEKLIKELNSLNKEVNYFYYPRSDHNLEPDWDLVVQRDLEFFQNFLN
ncbi:MAG: alpha/beta fold hydrolase [Candidatus Shapirobacteria bacterium]